MLIIPAIDILSGKCVRLVNGDFKTAKVYYDNPVLAAKHWKEKGATRIHVVDLDGARSGIRSNFDIARQIMTSVDISVQLGGGIRTLDDIADCIKAGAEDVILGSIAAYDQALLEDALKKYGNNIIVSIDCSGSTIAVNGWKTIYPISPLEFVEKIARLGVIKVIFTDISRDGTLNGISEDLIKRFCSIIPKVSVYIAGGIGQNSDIKTIRSLAPNIAGIIIGQALYMNILDFASAHATTLEG